jgi:hypothetical protein
VVQTEGWDSRRKLCDVLFENSWGTPES